MKEHESCSLFCLNTSAVKNLVQKGIAQGLVTCLLMLLVAGTLYAQSISSTITGVVVDSQDALVPNAKITANNLSKNVHLTTSSDAEGRFAFAQIEPGTYNITIEAQGFKKLERRGIELSTNTNLPLGEMKLQVGAVSDTVEVTAVGQHLQNESGDRSDTLLNKQVNNIALNSRNYLPLVALVPGVTTATAQGGVAGRGGLNQISVNGVRNNENNLELDGLNNVDTGSNGSQLTTISLDSVEEFRVLTNSYDAQYGHSAGAQILVLSKSGTPQYHGSGYWFHRNDSLNASNWANGLTKGKAFSPGSSNPDGTLLKQKFRLNDLGWTFGGPVQIPKVLTGLKDKMFFFASQEYQEQLAPQGNHFATVPTALERTGDFSQSLDKNGKPIGALKNITTLCGPAYTGNNVIPQSCFNPVGQAILKLFPSPTNNTGSTSSNFNSAVSNPSPRREDLVRLDYNINDKWKAFGRYIHNYDLQTNNYGSFALQAALIPEPITINSPGNGLTLGLTTFVNPTASNELTMGWEQGNISITPATPNLDRTATGLANFPLLFPNSVQDNTIPVMEFDLANGKVANSKILGGSNNGAGPFRNGNTTIQVNDNFSKTWGQHLAKFGFFFERSRKDQTNFGPIDGRIDFSDGDSSNPLDTGDAFANALLGVFRTYTQASNFIDGKYRYSNYEWYLQDNWKATRRLTLTYGIRFYVLPQQFEAGQFTSNFLPLRYDPTMTPRLYQPILKTSGKCPAGLPASATTCAFDPVTNTSQPAFDIGRIVPGSGSITDGIFQAGKGVSKYLTQNRGVQYAPRFGFAYDVTGQSNIVIRGGGGVYYDRSQGNIIFDELTNPPSIFTPILNNGLLSNVTPLTNINTTALGPPNISSILSSAKIPTVYAFNFGIQAKLPYSLVLDTAYVGTTASHLIEKLNLNAVPYGAAFLPQNQDPTKTTPPSNPGGNSLTRDFLRPFTGYGDITQYQSTGSSNFNSLQVSVNRRYAKGLFLGVAYTYGKSLGITSNDTDFIRIDNLNRQQNYGPLGIDRRHTVAIQYIYDIPGLFGKSGWAHSVLDGWQISGVTRLQSGAPYEVTASFNNGINNQNITGSFTEGSRVQQVLGDPFAGVSGDDFHRINPLAFAPPAVGSIGLGEKRNPFIGPGINNTDLSVQKTFGLGERFSLQTRIDAFNTFNHPQFTGINSNITYNSLTGGNGVSNISNLFDPVIRQNGFGSVSGARDPRVLQLMVRLVF
jgi:hypothetical protein